MYTESTVALPLLVDSLQLIVYRGLEEFVKSSQPLKVVMIILECVLYVRWIATQPYRHIAYGEKVWEARRGQKADRQV